MSIMIFKNTLRNKKERKEMQSLRPPNILMSYVMRLAVQIFKKMTEEKWSAIGQLFAKAGRKHSSTLMIDISSAGIS